MSSPDAVHFSIENFNEDFNMLKIIPCSNILELKFVHPSQSGFKSNHSTTTTLLDVTDFILNNMNEGKATGAIFLDLKKAFDTINHDLLIKKLDKYGISGASLKWFISYLNERSQAVNVSSSLSDF